MRFVHRKKYCAFLPTVVVFPYTRLQSDQSFMQEFVGAEPTVSLYTRLRLHTHQMARARAEAGGVRAGVFSVLKEA